MHIKTGLLSNVVLVPVISPKKRDELSLVSALAEDMGLEPTRLLHPTRFPGELLSHSVNPPHRVSTN